MDGMIAKYDSHHQYITTLVKLLEWIIQTVGGYETLPYTSDYDETFIAAGVADDVYKLRII